MFQLKHDRDKVGDFSKRVLLHIPIGFVIGAVFPLSFPLLWLFIKYEENEDLHTKDEAWKDYFGAMVGSSLGLLTLIILLLQACLS